LYALHYLGGERVRVYLEANRKRGRGIHGGLNDFVHPERIGPERLVAVGVEPEDLSSRFDQGRIEWIRASRPVVTTGNHQCYETAPKQCDGARRASHGRHKSSSLASPAEYYRPASNEFECHDVARSSI
jgi:hypothetical protein